MRIFKFLKKRRYVILSVITLVVIVAAALIIPEGYFSLYDKLTQDDVSYIKTDVNIYQPEYASFAEKLGLLGETYYTVGSSNMRRALANIISVYDREEILDAVVSELEQIYIIEDLVDSSVFTLENITVCRMYSLYASGVDDVTAFNYWKIRFEDVYGNTITCAIDEEFHKIYHIKIVYNTDELLSEAMDATERPEYYNEKYGATMSVSETDSSLLSSITYCLLYYYGIEDYEIYFDRSYTSPYVCVCEVFSETGDFNYTLGVCCSGNIVSIGFIPTDEIF